MKLTQLIDILRDYQAKYGNVPVYLGQASGPDLQAHILNATPQRVTIYPAAE